MSANSASCLGDALVSVIMPCYNAGPFVEEAVGSVLGQSYPYLELIVVDDGSTDGSLECLQALAAASGGRMHVHRQMHQGAFPARNLALRHAKGEWVAFLDADDYWTPDFLGRMLVALQTTGTDVAYCGWQNVGDGVSGTRPYLPPAYEDGDPVEAFLTCCPWPIHAALTRRGIVESIGGFSERRLSAMDYDLWLRLLGQTRRMVRVPEVMAFYRWHGQGQISSVKWRQVLDALTARLDFVRGHPDLVAHMPASRLRELTEGEVRREAYRALWKRDVVSAHTLFRHVAAARAFHAGDITQVAAALLPQPLYARVLNWVDSGSRSHV